MNENNNIPSYFSILTAEVRYDRTLTASEKIFYSEITCLCNAKGYCYSTNSYFAALYGVDSRTIRNWLSRLATKRYINIEFDEKTKKRKIFLVLNQNSQINEIKKINDEKRKNRKDNNNTMIANFMKSIK